MTADSQHGEQRRSVPGATSREFLLAASMFLICYQTGLALAQDPAIQQSAPETTQQKVERLTAAVAQAQTQMDTYQKQLLELRQELSALKQQLAAEKNTTAPANQPNAASTAGSATAQATIDEIREKQDIEESQIATHETIKVESQSKFPLTVSGLLLFNAFVNTSQVDTSASPAYAISGSGSTGLSVRQTILGLDARGPHLLNASSHADLRVDFFANGTESNYAASGILRLRTAHASLNWKNSEAFFALDRSILEPNEPTSLIAVAQPELAWAGNLWSWSPQVGVSQEFPITGSSRFKAQAALIDTADPQWPGTQEGTAPVNQTERSRWPGSEARIAFLSGQSGIGPEIGVGGYFSPHENGDGDRYDAWAATTDFRLPLGSHFAFTANAYRGQALAGLGAGGYVNYYYLYTSTIETARALDDIGGWTQFTANAGQRVQFNTGFGIDNPFAKEVAAALINSDSQAYYGLARNRSFYSNAIFSPSAYLMFSVEYKRLWSNYAAGPTDSSNSIGVGAGYKF